MTKAIFLNNSPAQIERVYALGRRERLASLCDLYGHVVSSDDARRHAAAMHEAEAVFSTWGMPRLDEAMLNAMPKLRIVLYAAGSVQAFARPLIERDIIVISGWKANGFVVAEYTASQILLANKGYFRNVRDCATPQRRAAGVAQARGNFGETVALLGAGAVGREVIQLLRRHNLNIIVWDPFLSEDGAKKLGVTKVQLDQAFRTAFVVSNHLAAKEETRHLLRDTHFRLMRDGAVYINNGRGTTNHEIELARVMRDRPDLTALLDVTEPEPPADDSPLYGLTNVLITSHIGGAMGDEVVRLADVCIEEFLAWRANQPLHHQVTGAMLATMA